MLISVSRRIAGALKAQYLLSVAATVMLAGCSASVERFASNPSDADPVYTASVQKTPSYEYAPQHRKRQIASSDQAGEETISSKPLASAPLSKPSGGYNYSTNYRAPAYKQPQLQAEQVNPPKVPARPQPLTTAEQVAPPAPAAGTVTVGPGMTLYSIAHGSGISIRQLAVANGLKPPYAVHQGQVLRIPSSASAEAAPAKPLATLPFKEKTAAAEAAPAKAKLAAIEPAPKATKAERVATAVSGSHQVASGDTLYSLGRKYHVKAAEIAAANGLDAKKPLKIGSTIKIPSAGATVADARTKPAADANQQVIGDNAGAMPAPATKADKAKPAAVAAQQPAAPAAQATQQTADATAGNAASPPADTAGGMRWPVRGKVISGFGAKPNGLKNEGINIAVPEGTSVRAADSGVVAYAGNELKGYGNLVLIRHDNGMVTAYAHAKELFVKRGDTVKRGDVIAKAGQTGSVTSPQLHFEVRKGATALDPLTYLNSATASN